MALVDLVSRNVAALVDPIRLERQRSPSALSSQQSRQLLDAAEGERLGALYITALSLGLRQAEILGVRWSDITGLESEQPNLTVTTALQRFKGEFKLVEPKTKKSRRTVALSKLIVKALLAHRRRQAAERLALGPAWQDHDLVFCALDGSPIERTWLHRNWKQLLAKEGCPTTYAFTIFGTPQRAC